MSQLFGASFSLDPQLLVFFVGTVPKISNVYETLFNDLAHKVTVLVSVCRLFIDCERATVCASVCVCAGWKRLISSRVPLNTLKSVQHDKIKESVSPHFILSSMRSPSSLVRFVFHHLDRKHVEWLLCRLLLSFVIIPAFRAFAIHKQYHSYLCIACLKILRGNLRLLKFILCHPNGCHP